MVPIFSGLIPILWGWYQFCHCTCHINSELQPGPKLAAHAILSNKLEMAGIGRGVVFCEKKTPENSLLGIALLFLYFCISEFQIFRISVFLYCVKNDIRPVLTVKNLPLCTWHCFTFSAPALKLLWSAPERKWLFAQRYQPPTALTLTKIYRKSNTKMRKYTTA